MSGITTLIIVGAVMFSVLGGITLLAYVYSLNNIKSKTVGDGQHGTARWMTKGEQRKIYNHIPFTPVKWRDQAKSGKEVSSRSPARGRRHRWRQRDGRTKADGSKEPSASQKQSEQKQTTEASSRSNRKGRQERRFSAITQAGDC